VKEDMRNKSTDSIRNQYPRSANREHSVPLYLTSSFTFENAEQARALFAEEMEGNIYSRFSNPNVSEFINKMVLLEKSEDGFAYATGMAAIFASLAALLKSGDHVVATRSLFGSSHQILVNILPKWGIECTYVEAAEPQNWEMAIRKNTKMFFTETPSNPGLDIVDLFLAQKLKEKYNLILNVDNTFASPVIQTPADFGADLISHSATKYIDGQGRVLGGVIVGKKELIDEIRFFSRHTGPAMSPFNAWLLSKSLETLELRVTKHCENALKIARLLEKHPGLEKVKYPGLQSHPQYILAGKLMSSGGGIVTFNVKGGFDGAKKFADNLKMISVSANLGDTRSIVTHPASTTHSKLTKEEQERVSIFPGLIRLSVGLEDFEDIKEDVIQALNF
jgi:O-succinylhomoserine sulfhydrylase